MTDRMRRVRGFTLLELLVVIVIIGIVTTFAVISINLASRDPARDDARQLADLTGLAAEQAVMQGQEYGLRVESHGYAFYVFDGRKWSLVQGDNVFYRRDLGDEVTLSLQLEGTPATLAPPPATVQNPEDATASAPAQEDQEPGQQQDRPQVLLLSSGEMPPFEIDITGTATGATYKVKGTLADGITVQEPEAASPGRKP